MTVPLVDPGWSAARAGLPGDTSAGNYASQIGQFLTSHGVTPVYEGLQIVTPVGDIGTAASFAPGYAGIAWADLGSVDVDQPFTMPAGDTAVGRVTLPLAQSGAGADVTVSLCADSSGVPGTVITSVTFPGSWLGQLAAPAGVAAGPLATAASNTLRLGALADYAWSAAASGGIDGAVYPSQAVSGNWLVMAGGYAPSGSGSAVSAVTAARYAGGTVLATPVPLPSLPQAAAAGALAATADTLVYAGGIAGTGSYVPYTTVWCAGWSPSSGAAAAWSAQQALPQVLTTYGSCASWGETVYLVGGYDSAANLSGSVLYSTVSNGQITAWHYGPPLPVPTVQAQVAVVEGWLIAAGGIVTSGASQVATAAVWYAPVAADGTPGGWQAGPPLPYGSGNSTVPGASVTGGMIVPSASGIQVLAVSADGPGPSWQMMSPGQFGNWPAAAFPSGAGQWQVFSTYPALYRTGTLTPVPAVSVPLPASGLTAGATYHLLLHQDGGSAADYVQVALDPAALPSAALTRPAGGGSWTGEADGYALIAGVHDQTAAGMLLHTWEDSGARVTTLVRGAASGQLLGVAESVVFPAGAPEAALSTVTGVDWAGSPWRPSGCTQLA